MKILFLSTIIYLAFSNAAPAGGYLGCNNVAAPSCGVGDICASATGIFTCSTTTFGFKCLETNALVALVSTDDCVSAIDATNDAF